MNLIKFKDVVVTDISIEDKDFFNNRLRGKYAYWVRCRFVIPMDEIDSNRYVSFETTINNMFGYTYYGLIADEHDHYSYEVVAEKYLSDVQKNEAILVNVVPENPQSTDEPLIKTCNSHVKYIDLWDDKNIWINRFIDYTESDKVNNVDHLKIINSYVPDDNITLDELKRFRTWIAEQLLEFNPSWTENETHVLEYYANNMYDDNLKWIQEFSHKTVDIIQNVDGQCGCGSSNLSSLYNDSVSVCDPVSMYKNGIKKSMINMFSKIEMWTSLPSLFLTEIKKYIDGIIQANLPFNTPYDGVVFGCDCLNNYTAQEAAIGILKNLSNSLEYIIGDSIDGHKNYISKSLTDWATNLYEIMQWN